MDWTARRRSRAAEHDVSLGALQRTMRDVFGFDTFRPGQLGCARAVLAGRDAAVFMVTGSGKSLCYQLPAFHAPRATVLVVSPLISLMDDQVLKLNHAARGGGGGGGGAPVAVALHSARADGARGGGRARGRLRLVCARPSGCSAGFLERVAAAARRAR